MLRYALYALHLFSVWIISVMGDLATEPGRTSIKGNGQTDVTGDNQSIA